MSERCVCENPGVGGPPTRRAPKHLSTCDHSDLRLTTKRYRPRAIRQILGTRKLIAVELSPKQEQR